PRVADGAETLHRSQRLTRYHGSGRPSRKNPPVGPSFVNVAAHTTLAAPAATGRPPAPPMSVATQPGQTAFTRMPSSRSSAASIRVSALSVRPHGQLVPAGIAEMESAAARKRVGLPYDLPTGLLDLSFDRFE